jgi:aminopeptidase N
VPFLGRLEAESRSAVLRPVSYSAQLELTSDSPTFDSVTRIEFTAEPGATSFVDVRPQALRSATLNGEPLDVSTLVEGRLPLPVLRSANVLVVDAVMSYSHDGEGLVRHVDPADGRTYVYAMSFLDAAPRWFACFDQPDLKAPMSFQVTCPDDWTVAGNGAAVHDAAGVWTLAQRRPLATYLATVIAGPYHSVRGEHDGIPLVLHARASLAEFLDRDAPALLEHTGRCFDEFHRLFGLRYPWGEYHQAFVPDFNAGAMENPGCVTFRDQMIFRSQATDSQRLQRDNTIAHEMAHMWFGDVVTMRWWSDLWLNESFAEYLAHRVCDALGETAAWVQFGVQRKAWGYAADRRPSTHPVAGNGAADTASALNDFDGISYAKGAAVLRQLATRLGDETFLAGLRSYIAYYAFGNAELADLLAAWTAAGATELPEWASQWLRKAGLDTLRYADGVVHREPPADRPAQREHAITVASYDAGGTPVQRVGAALSGDSTAIEIAPAALVLPDANDETWAKIALPVSTWTVMPALLPGLEPIPRVVVWNALQLAVADADLAPSAAIDIGTAAVPAEDNDTVLSAVLAWAIGPLGGAYLSPEARPAALTAIAQAAATALDASPPGSGRQLAALRGLIAAETDAGRLRGVLAGAVPDGVRLDPDLRWRVVGRLCTLGEFRPADIDAELRADDSSEGAEQAAYCRAARPDAAAKDAAWELLMHDSAVANSVLYATATGFWRPAQHALTAPYVERYFAEIVATAQLRSGWVVGRLAALAFPWTSVDRATLALVGALVARPDVPIGIRRSVIDRGDDLRRAVLSRERFA